MKVISSPPEYINFTKKLFKGRSKDKFNAEKFTELGDLFLQANDKYFVALYKIADYLNSIKEPKRAVLVNCTPLPTPTQLETAAAVVDEQPVATSSELVSKTPRVLTDEEKRAKKNLLKLNEAINECSKKIQALEEQELSLDDLNSDRSVYIIESHMKLRFNKLKGKYLKLARKYPTLIENTSDDEECEVIKANITNVRQHMRQKKRIYELKSFNFTRYKDLNEKVEEFCRKLKEFPDYADIEEIIQQSNDDLGLGLNVDMCKEISADVFKQIGNELKRKREDYDRDCLLSRFENVSSVLDDTTANDEKLKAELVKNREEAEKKTKQIIDEYVAKAARGEDFDENETEIEIEVDNESNDETTPLKRMRESNKKDDEKIFQLNNDIKEKLMNRFNEQMKTRSQNLPKIASVSSAEESVIVID